MKEGQVIGTQGKPSRLRVPAESQEEIAATVNRLDDIYPGNGAGGSAGDSVFISAEDKNRALEQGGESPCNQSKHPACPKRVREDDR